MFQKIHQRGWAKNVQKSQKNMQDFSVFFSNVTKNVAFEALQNAPSVGQVTAI